MTKKEDLELALGISQHHENCEDYECEYECPFYDFSRTGALHPQELQQVICTLDDSAPYEMDITLLARTHSGYALIECTGCSCWDGEGEVYIGKTPEEILQNVKSRYPPNNTYKKQRYQKLRDALRRAQTK